MIEIGLFVVAQMALGSSATPREVALPQEQESVRPTEFGNVLTRYLREATESQEREGDTEDVSSEHENQVEMEPSLFSLAASFLPFAADLDVSVEAEDIKPKPQAVVSVNTGIEYVDSPEGRQSTGQLGEILFKPPDLGQRKKGLDSESLESHAAGGLPDEQVLVVSKLLEQGLEQEQVERPLLELSSGEDLDTAENLLKGKSMDMDEIVSQHGFLVPEPAEMVVGKELSQPRLRTWRGASTEQSVEPVVQSTAEVEGHAFVLPEVETSFLDAELAFKAHSRLKQQTVPEMPIADVAATHSREVAGVAFREGVGPITPDQAPAKPQEEVDTLGLVKEDAFEVSVKAQGEKNQELISQQGERSGETVLAPKNTPRERPWQAPSDIVLPGDVGAVEPLVESAEADTQIRAVLNFEDRENLFPKLVQSMESLVLEERSEVRIQLKPDHLGELKIKLSMERGIMMAEFVVQDQTVREVIASQLPQLQTALQEHGTQMADVSVSIGLGHKGTDDEGQPKSRQSGQHSHGRLQKESTTGERAYLGRSIWNQVDVRV